MHCKVPYGPKALSHIWLYVHTTGLMVPRRPYHYLWPIALKQSLHTLLAILAFTGCKPPSAPPTTGVVVAPEGWQQSRIQVRAGMGWVLPGAPPLALKEGRFSAPPTARAVTASYDSDGNGLIDVGREPLTHCTLGSRGWRCLLTHKRLALLQYSEDNATLRRVHLEAFHPKSGLPDTSGDLCENGQCSDPENTSNVAEIDYCGTDSLAFESKSSKVTTSHHVDLLAKVQVNATISKTEQDWTLRAQVNVPPSRILAQLYSKSGGVLWNSESAERNIVDNNQIEIALPTQLLQAGEAKRLQLQVVNIRNPDGDVIQMSEGRWEISRENWL